MAKRASFEGIVRIIEAAGKCGVKHLKYGDLEVHFELPLPEVETPAPQATSITRELTEEEKLLLEQQRFEDELNNLKITNPLEYERILEREASA